MEKSNVSVKSNVYVLDGEFPFGESNFIKKVKDLKALAILKGARFSNVHLQDWQLKLIDRGMHCSVHDERERPFGLVARGDKLYFECRCSIIRECPHASEGRCWEIYRG
ncbi:hypothetical protein [Geomonas agri]|uniref:hypothetical protein n=1 Tax=Geomonas agri TaxID=2873702 RepID=UPI001CD4AEA3|nr:hypothetical protein [Geomonas agri]